MKFAKICCYLKRSIKSLGNNRSIQVYFCSVNSKDLRLEVQQHCQLENHVIVEIFYCNEGLRTDRWLIASNYRMLHYGCVIVLEYCQVL
jgi:hypothetical protein